MWDYSAQAGYMKAPTGKLAIFTRFPGDVTIDVEGLGVFTVTPTAYGDNDSVPQGVVGYRALFELAGLSEFTQYTYHISQAGRSEVERDCAFMTLPGEDDDWAMFFSSCDSPGGAINPMAPEDRSGYWPEIVNYCQNGALPVPFILFADDDGYPAGQAVVAGNDGVSMVLPPASTGLIHDYCTVYTALHGLYDETDQGSAALWFGADESRHWLAMHCNKVNQIGDWEVANDMGFDTPTQDVTGTPSNVAIYAAAIDAYNTFRGDVNPPSIGVADTTALHWGFEAGFAYICAPDYITNADGNYPTTLPTQFYGSGQITDILNAMDNDCPVKIMAMGQSIRYLYDPASATEFASGAQHPLFDTCLTEYQRMFTETGQTPPSLMDNPRTNGLRGFLLTLHGDLHREKWEHHQAPAYTGNAAENFHSITIGGNNSGAARHSITSAGADIDYAGSGMSSIAYGYLNNLPLPLGGANPGLTLLKYLGYIDPDTGAADAGFTSGERWRAGVRIEFYGSRFPKEVHVYKLGALTKDQLDAGDYNRTQYFGKFIHRYGGNDAHDVDVEVVPMMMYATSAID